MTGARAQRSSQDLSAAQARPAGSETSPAPGARLTLSESLRAGGGAGSGGGRHCWFVFLLSTDSLAAFVRSAASLSGCHGDAHFTDKETDLGGGAGKATCSRSLGSEVTDSIPWPPSPSAEASVPGPAPAQVGCKAEPSGDNAGHSAPWMQLLLPGPRPPPVSPRGSHGQEPCSVPG